MGKLRKAVYWIAGILFGLIIVGGLTLAVKSSSVKLPAPPVFTNSADTNVQDAKSKEIVNYKELVQAIQAQQTNIYDFVVIKTFLSVLTSILTVILTYIFAKTALDFYGLYLKRKDINHKA